MGIPGRIKPPLQAFQDQRRPAGRGQAPVPHILPGIDLDLNGVPAPGIGGGSCQQLVSPEGRHPQSHGFIRLTGGKAGNQVPAPFLLKAFSI